MKTKHWIFLFALLLLVCAGLSLYFLRPGDAATFAEISSQGQILQTIDLSRDQEFTLETPDGGYNVVTVRSGKIAVTQANCPDQYCVKRGFCSSGAQIVCLPHRLVIRFLSSQSIDSVAE